MPRTLWRAAVLAGAFAVSALSGPAAFAEDLTFMFDNQSSTAVRELYASAVDVDNWEEDILGQDTLAAGGFARVTISNSETCDYDLKIVFDDDTELEERGIDLCSTGSYTVSDPE